MVVQVISAPILCPTCLGCEIPEEIWALVTGEAGLGLQFALSSFSSLFLG